MQCPSCQKDVDVKDKDFGALFTCPQCRSVYFINFDGTPDFGEVVQPSDDELKRLQNLAIPEKKKKKKQEQESEKTQEAEQQEVYAEAHEEAQDEVQAPQWESESTNEQPQLNEFHIDSMTTESQPQSIETVEVPSAEPVFDIQNQIQPQDFTSVASEIESFGNDQTIVAGISYDLEVIGLDTKETQELFHEAIDDSRFGWHTEDLVKEIRTGRCVLVGLTPIQAFVLAKRIQFIDIEMKWKQNVLA